MKTTGSSQYTVTVDFGGPEGKTIFWDAKKWLFAGPSLQRAFNETWENYKEIRDERLLALVAAMCVEGAVDELLLAFAPGFRECMSDTHFTFSVKIKSLRSLRLLPGRIVASCDLVRQIRNEFAHQLEKRSFKDVGETLRSKLLRHVESFNAKERDPHDYSDQFTDLVGFTIFALLVYTRQASELRAYVETDAGRKAFADWSQTPR